MAIHDEILEAVQRLCAERAPDFTFTMKEVVRALPHRNPNTVRTQIGHFCSETSPAHLHKYFRWKEFGRYELLEEHRRQRAAVRPAPAPFKDTIHVVISPSGGMYVADCHEVAVVTQGRTLDETMANLKEALELHLDDDERRTAGVVSKPRIAVTYETALTG